MIFNTLLAKLDHKKSQFKQMVQDYYHFFTKTQGAFKGIKKTFVPRDGYDVNPNYMVNQKVVTTVDEKFDWFNEQFKSYLSDLLSVESTNSVGAKTIELVVGGISFGKLTAAELMRIKGVLTDKALDNVYNNIPVREDSVVWKPCEDGEYSGRSIFQTDVVQGQTRTSEITEEIIRDPNLDPEHIPSGYVAAKTKVNKTYITGDYTMQSFTGEWTHRKRAELLRRKSQLLEAVIAAIKDINTIEAVPTNLDVNSFVNYLTTGSK